MEDLKRDLKKLWLSSDKVHSVLENLWLNDNEIGIYLSSLSLWPTTASILWKRIGIKRSTAQYTCQSLASKKIMTMIQKSNTYIFSAEEPEKLIYLLNKEISWIKKKKDSIEQIMWELRTIVNPFWNIPKIRYYQWFDELKELTEDIFKENKPLYWVLKLFEESKIVNSFIRDIYVPKRIESNICAKMMFNDNQITQHYRDMDKQMHRYTLLIPGNLFPFDSCLHIYGNKVVFYSFHNDDFIGILVENANIRNTMFSLFKMAWEQGKQYEINHVYKEIEL